MYKLIFIILILCAVSGGSGCSGGGSGGSGCSGGGLSDQKLADIAHA